MREANFVGVVSCLWELTTPSTACIVIATATATISASISTALAAITAIALVIAALTLSLGLPWSPSRPNPKHPLHGSQALELSGHTKQILPGPSGRSPRPKMATGRSPIQQILNRRQITCSNVTLLSQTILTDDRRTTSATTNVAVAVAVLVAVAAAIAVALAGRCSCSSVAVAVAEALARCLLWIDSRRHRVAQDVRYSGILRKTCAASCSIRWCDSLPLLQFPLRSAETAAEKRSNDAEQISTLLLPAASTSI